MKKNLLAVACLLVPLTQAQPYAVEQLQLRAVITLNADLEGLPASSMYNPRCFDGNNFVCQINVGAMAIGRYPSGYNKASAAVDNAAVPIEHRTLAPFRGAYKTTYMLGCGGNDPNASPAYTKTLSRYDWDGQNRVDAETPDALAIEGFDWVDDDTIIGTVYNSGVRKRLYLIDVKAQPFEVSRNTLWNANGYVETSITTRIRNVRVGDKYPGYAYYCDAGQNSYPNFYAINLADGAETVLGSMPFELVGSGSFGLWTAVERGGYLYLHTTNDGIYVYKLNGATTLGDFVVMYGKADLDALIAPMTSAQFWGFDVTPDHSKLLLAGSNSRVFELGPPILNIGRSEENVVLSWPLEVTSVLVQSSQTPGDFKDVDPAPEFIPNESDRTITVTIPNAVGQQYYRLKKSW